MECRVQTLCLLVPRQLFRHVSLPSDDARRENYVVGNLAIACYLRTIAEYAAVAHLRVVADVHAFHKEIVRPDDGLATTMGSTVDNNILSDDVIVADNTLAFFANEVEILWQCANNAALVYLVSVAYSAAIQNADEWKHNTVVANYYIVFDVNEWKYFAAVALSSLSERPRLLD